MPKGFYRFDGPVICQRCRIIFDRPPDLEPHVPATHCDRCRVRVDVVEAKAKHAARVGRRNERKRSAKYQDAEQILSPLLMDIEKPVVRKPGEPGWIRGELGL